MNTLELVHDLNPIGINFNLPCRATLIRITSHYWINTSHTALTVIFIVHRVIVRAVTSLGDLRVQWFVRGKRQQVNDACQSECDSQSQRPIVSQRNGTSRACDNDLPNLESEKCVVEKWLTRVKILDEFVPDAHCSGEEKYAAKQCDEGNQSNLKRRDWTDCVLILLIQLFVTLFLLTRG
jgi:hypothetical protein